VSKKLDLLYENDAKGPICPGSVSELRQSYGPFENHFQVGRSARERIKNYSKETLQQLIPIQVLLSQTNISRDGLTVELSQSLDFGQKQDTVLPIALYDEHDDDQDVSCDLFEESVRLGEINAGVGSDCNNLEYLKPHMSELASVMDALDSETQRKDREEVAAFVENTVRRERNNLRNLAIEKKRKGVLGSRRVGEVVEYLSETHGPNAKRRCVTNSSYYK